ncbi:MAG: secD, partial [Microbacterium sp.]|nr:secD [Microbacterium sp.]
MATPTPVRHAWRALLGLVAITAILFGVNALGVHVFKNAAGEPASSWVPELAL